MLTWQEGSNSQKHYPLPTEGQRQKRDCLFLWPFFEELRPSQFYLPKISLRVSLTECSQSYAPCKATYWQGDWNLSDGHRHWCLGELSLKHKTSQSSLSVWTKLRVLLAEKNNAICSPPPCNECFSTQQSSLCMVLRSRDFKLSAV